MTTIVYYYVHFDFTKFAIFGDPVLSQLELRSVRVMYTVLLVSVLTVRILNIIVNPEYGLLSALINKN